MSIEVVTSSNYLILCRPLLLPPSVFPSIRVFLNESVLLISWPKYWNFSFSISPSREYSGLIPLGWTDWISFQSKRHRYGRGNFHLSDTVLNHVRFTKLIFLHFHSSLLSVLVNGNKFIYTIYLK